MTDTVEVPRPTQRYAIWADVDRALAIPERPRLISWSPRIADAERAARDVLAPGGVAPRHGASFVIVLPAAESAKLSAALIAFDADRASDDVWDPLDFPSTVLDFGWVRRARYSVDSHGRRRVVIDRPPARP